MQVNPEIFRAYDIRGEAGKDITPEVTTAIGKAFGTYIRKKGGKKVSVGHDNRFTSQMFSKSLIEGIVFTGCDVIDIDLCPTPAVYFSIFYLKLDGGIAITGSHNTAGFNGFKLNEKEAYPLFGGPLEEIRKLVEKENFALGKGTLNKRDVLDDYKKRLLKSIKLEREVSVVVDCANGASGKLAPEVFREAGCKVFPLYCDVKGGFHHHEPDPEVPANLKDLAAHVRKNKADIGLAFDADGDRLGVLDENGVFFDADKVLLFLARDILRQYPGKRVIYDVKASYIMDAEIKKYGGIPVIHKTGRADFRWAMREKPDIILGGEVSGHLFFADKWYGFDDGLYAALRIVEILSQSKKKFSEHFGDVPKTVHTQEFNPPCPDNLKQKIVNEVKQFFKQRYKTIELDGVRVLFDETSWAIIRASGTTPAISIRFEADINEKLDKIIDIVYDKLKEYPEVGKEWYREAKRKVEMRKMGF